MIAAAVCVAAILARIAWVTGAAAFSRWRCRPQSDGTPGPRDPVALNARQAAVVGWCGMRGTVTLAAALALPTGFPYRDLILVTAFGVVLGTLVLQGLTLRPLMLRLRLENDDTVEREVRLARIEGLRAAVAAIARVPGAEGAALVRQRYELQLRRAGEYASDNVGGNGTAVEQEADLSALRAATEAQRRRVVALRGDGTIGDTAFQRVEEELDWAELDWARLLRAENGEM
jgi:CPA1 family monovalent cation:H+ antiporter